MAYATRREMTTEDISSGAMVSFLNQVYAWMTGGLLLTGIIAWYTHTSVSPTVMRQWFMPAIIGEFVLVLGLAWLAPKLAAPIMAIGFIAYAALNGFTLSLIFGAYSLGTLGTAFYITAGTFGAMSLYGMLTKRDLTSLGSLCLMALVGLIIAGIVNLFLHNTKMDLIISALAVLVFVGLTAYDTQKIKQLHEEGARDSRLALLGALSLYLDFINLFLAILRLLGSRK